MKTTEKTVREPLFHIIKRSTITWKKALLIRAIAIVAALIVGGILVFALKGINPFEFYAAMLDGTFGKERRIWNLFYDTAILLCISLAVTPAFRMRFWNCGAEGQTLIGGLACVAVMHYLGGHIPLPLLWVLMTVAAILGGMIWALIPAIFKAIWNTNETLFTLMMNYVATFLVTFFIGTWVTSGSGIMPPMEAYGLPTIPGNKWLLNIIIVLILTAIVYVYLQYSKHGYEISVVGESEKTARYIGINVKKVILRTMLVSGALCGVAGLILVGGTDHCISIDTVGGDGFTAIMVSWLAKFNPLIMLLTSFLLVFLRQGSLQVSSTFKINDAISDIISGIIIFFIIGCEFFINYRIVFRHDRKEG